MVNESASRVDEAIAAVRLAQQSEGATAVAVILAAEVERLREELASAKESIRILASSHDNRRRPMTLRWQKAGQNYIDACFFRGVVIVERSYGGRWEVSISTDELVERARFDSTSAAAAVEAAEVWFQSKFPGEGIIGTNHSWEFIQRHAKGVV